MVSKRLLKIFSVRGSTFKVFSPIWRFFSPFFSLVKKQQLLARFGCLKTRGFCACVKENKKLMSSKSVTVLLEKSVKLNNFIKKR